MTKKAVSVTGGRELRKAFKSAGDDMADLRLLHKSLADDVAGTAKTKVPVKSGRLQRSVRGAGTKTFAAVRAGNNRVSGPSSVPYAGPIHFGWARPRNPIRPQPFLYEALDERRKQVVDRYNREVRRKVRKVF